MAEPVPAGDPTEPSEAEPVAPSNVSDPRRVGQNPDSGDDLDRIFSLTLDMLCVAGFDGYFKRLNPAWEEVLGYPPSELMQRPYFEFIHPEDRERTRAEAAQLAAGVKTVSFENRYRCRDGSYRWLLWNAAPAPQEGLIYAAARDITERKAAEEALERYARDLEAARAHEEENAARLAHLVRELETAWRRAEEATRAKSDFLARISHEIRTPLTAILGMTELALETPLSAAQREHLETVRGSAQALMRLLTDLLDLSRVEAGKLDLERVRFSLRGSLEEAVRLLRPRAEQKRLVLALEVAPDAPDSVVGDPGRLRQVVLNLVANAIKFTERGGVTVAVEPDRSVAGAGQLAEVALRFTVTDTGIGIPEDRREAIFEAFTQAGTGAAGSEGGSGLGLAIAAQLVELMGGRIGVESEVGEGSRFRFTARFDLAGARPEAAGERRARPAGGASSAMRSEPARRLRILLAEDDPATRKLVSIRLAQRGHEVEAVADGQAALAALGAEAERFDAAVLDVRMPGRTGIEVARAVRKREAAGGRRLPLVALTALAGAADRERCRGAGMDACVAKPIRFDELFAALEGASAEKGEKGPPGASESAAAAARGSSPPPAGPAPEDLLARFGGDRGLLAEVAALFLADLPGMLEAVRRAAESGDGEALAAAAHRLKGSAGNFGAEGVAEAAHALERMGRSGLLAGAMPTVERLEAELDRLSAALRRATGVPGSAGDAAAEPGGGDG